MKTTLLSLAVVFVTSVQVHKSLLKAAYNEAKCCPSKPGYNKCNMVNVSGVSFTQFTCDQVYELYCGGSDMIQIGECELCWGEHTDPDCMLTDPAGSPPPIGSPPPT